MQAYTIGVSDVPFVECGMLLKQQPLPHVTIGDKQRVAVTDGLQRSLLVAGNRVNDAAVKKVGDAYVLDVPHTVDARALVKLSVLDSYKKVVFGDSITTVLFCPDRGSNAYEPDQLVCKRCGSTLVRSRNKKYKSMTDVVHPSEGTIVRYNNNLLSGEIPGIKVVLVGRTKLHQVTNLNSFTTKTQHGIATEALLIMEPHTTFVMRNVPPESDTPALTCVVTWDGKTLMHIDQAWESTFAAVQSTAGVLL